jgi:transcriptional regulator with XRE-family HTH domain
MAARERFEMAFGEVFRERRFAASRSQEDVAASAEISTFYLRELEHGRKSATLESIARLARALDCAPHELVAAAEKHWSAGDVD